MEFNITDLFKFYFKNIMLALLIFGITLGSTYYYFFEVYESEYVANTTIMLGANEEITDIGFNQKVINNYLELVKSKNVLDYTINKTELTYTNSELKGMVSASYAEDTEFITISVISSNKEDSAKLSYAIYEGLVVEVERIFKVHNIHLVDTDTIGYVKYSDKLLLLLVICLSFAASFCVITINYLFFPNFILQTIVSNTKKNLLEKINKHKEKKVLLKITNEKKKETELLPKKTIKEKVTNDQKNNSKTKKTSKSTIKKKTTKKVSKKSKKEA